MELGGPCTGGPLDFAPPCPPHRHANALATYANWSNIVAQQSAIDDSVPRILDPYTVGQKGKLSYRDRYFKGRTIVLTLNSVQFCERSTT